MIFDNLFSYCKNDIIIDDANLYIEDYIDGINIINFFFKGDYIYKYSNDFLYLIVDYYNVEKFRKVYEKIIECYDNIKNKPIDYFINEQVISFITSFSKGTGHGYSAIYQLIIQYHKNYTFFKNFKIIMFKNTQQGIFDLVKYYVPEEKIIVIDIEKIYKFRKIILIPITDYVPSAKLALDFYPFISKIASNKLIRNEKIALLKSSNSQNLTCDGIIPYKFIEKYCSKHGFQFIDPTNFNEIDVIKILFHCKTLITSWGTTYSKNIMYLSGKCKQILVIVYGKEFIDQYNLCIKNNDGIISTKCKNAYIYFHKIDTLNELEQFFIR